MTLTELATLDRRAHIEPWLTALADARHPDGRAHSIGHRRGQILAVRQFLADITEWGWPAAPARPLLFARDIPDAPQPGPAEVAWLGGGLKAPPPGVDAPPEAAGGAGYWGRGAAPIAPVAGRALLYVIAVLASCLFMGPFFFTVTSSLKTSV